MIPRVLEILSERPPRILVFRAGHVLPIGSSADTSINAPEVELGSFTRDQSPQALGIDTCVAMHKGRNEEAGESGPEQPLNLEQAWVDDPDRRCYND